MSQFNDRESAHEKKFTLDQEQEFKAQARRAKLLGLWAAGEMSVTGDAAEAYAKSLVVHDLKEAGEEDVFRKVRADLDAKGVTVSDHQIRVKMDEFLQTARAQIAAGA